MEADSGTEYLHELLEPEDPTGIVLDVVAVNGLNGNSITTWSTNGQGQPFIWIRNPLPLPVMNTRSLTYEYNSSSFGPQNVFTPDGFNRAAKKLVELLVRLRHNMTECPVTFIAHDIGGLVVMKALTIAREQMEHSFWSEGSPKLVFFGTPQRVTDIRSWEDSLFRLVSITSTSADLDPELLSRVRQMSKTLLRVTEEFNCSLVGHCIVNVYEGATDGPPVICEFISTTDSIYENKICRKTTHRNLCKLSQDDEALRIIQQAINIEIDRDLVKCLSKLSSLAPQFQLPSKHLGEIGDFEGVKELNSLLTMNRSSAIYIHSGPGTGKIVFGSALFQSQQLSHGLAGYYSFSGGDMQQTTTTSFLSSLIHQILNSNPLNFDIVRNLYTTIEKQSLWNSHTLWAILTSLLSSARLTSFICIVNGVHNWDSSKEQYLPQLLSDMEDHRFPIPVKFVFIGEVRRELSSLFQLCPILQLDSDTFCSRSIRSRINLFLPWLREKSTVLGVQHLTNSLEEKLLDCQDLNQLSITVEVIKQRIHNGFTYTKPDRGGTLLNLAATAGPLTDNHDSDFLYNPISLISELEQVPYDIESLVAATFKSLPKWALRALSWILRARRPMSTNKLAIALSLVEHKDKTSFDKSRLYLDISTALKRTFGPLLVLNGGGVSFHNEEVKNRFLHIVDDIETRLPADGQAALGKGQTGILSHWEITRLLLKFLSSTDFTEETKNALHQNNRIKSQNPVFDFASYAILFWPAHFLEATGQGSHVKHLLRLLPINHALLEWQELYCDLGGKSMRPSFRTENPLLLASEFGFSDVIDVYLTSGEAEHIFDAVLCASCGGNLDIVKLLLPNDKLRKQSSTRHLRLLEKALIEAARRGFEHIAKYLLDYLELLKVSKIDIFEANPILLCEVAEFGFFRLVKLFVTNEAPVDGVYCKLSPLQLASKNGHELIVKYLLNHDSDTNTQNSDIAEDYRSPSVLSRNRVNPYRRDTNNRTILHLAAQNGHRRTIDLLIDNDEAPLKLADIDNDGRTALHLAAQNGHTSIVRKLVDLWKEGIDKYDKKQETPLSLAIKNGRAEVVNVLLEHGAKADTVGISKHTPLFTATVLGYDTVAFSILRSTNYHSFVDIGSVLQEAARQGFAAVCGLCLVQLGNGNMNYKDRSGRTALHSAALGGYSEIVTLLLENGSDCRIADWSGHTALASAVFSRKWTCVEVLLQWYSKFEPSKNADLYRSLLVHLTRCEPPTGSIERIDHVKTIRALLVFGVDPNSQDPDTELTALHFAARWGMVEVISLLLEFGASPRFRSPSDGWTALFYAVKYNHKEATRSLLHPCGGPLLSDNDGWTPLHLALAIPVMKLLVEADKKTLQIQTPDGSTPLHTAIESPEVTEWLLQHGAQVDAQTINNETTLMLAVMRDFRETVEVILNFKPDLRLVDSYGRNVLHHAALQNSVHALHILLDACQSDAPITDFQDNQNRSPLHIASRLSQVDSIECLRRSNSQDKKLNINPNLQDKGGNTPLLLAVKAKNGSIVEKLLAFGVDANIRNHGGETGLFVAIKEKSITIWKELLTKEGRANVNLGDMEHPTVLHFLAYTGDLQTLEELAENHGADIDAKGGPYCTPLQAAAAEGFDEVVLYLLRKGANASVTGGLFGHALTAAAFSGSRDCITKLLEETVDVNHQDDQGRTALHIAAWRGNFRNFRTLIESGKADMFVTDSQGRTVMHHAAAGGCKNIIELLSQDPTNAERLNVPDIHGWWPVHWGCRVRGNNEVVMLLARSMPSNWPQMETLHDWTPERIANFHDASDLLNAWLSEGSPARLRIVGYSHLATVCDGCFQEPIYGVRWRCMTCESFSLCFKCDWTRKETHPHLDFYKQGPE